jgi:hypothetical protein
MNEDTTLVILVGTIPYGVQGPEMVSIGFT